MAKKNLILTPQGHRVMGALATYIVPKLAADQALQSVELESLCKSITPGRYDRQIDGIVGTVKERFGSRLAQDESFGDLRKVLSALMPSSLAMDKAKEEEAEDEAEDEGEDGFEDFMKNAKKKKKDAAKAKDKKACDEDDEDEDEDDEDEDEDDEDEDKAKDKKAKDKFPAKDKKAKKAADADNDADLDNEEDDMSDEEEDQWVKTKKAKDKRAKDAAMDSRIDAARTEGADLALRRLEARYKAAEIVKPIVGNVNVMATDAASIYKLALDAKNIDTNGVPRSMYGAMVKAVLQTDASKPKARIAQDKGITKSLLEEFPNLPGMA